MVYLRDVSKQFGDFSAVKNVSLNIKEGESVALLGPNGAGKTTLLEMIEGLQNPTEGKISIGGFTYKENEKEIRKILGLAFQETRFGEKLRVDEALDLFATFYSVSTARVETLLDWVSLRSKRKAYVNDLSGGQRQRLALAIGMVNSPRVLLLDEPSTGLDPHARREIWKVLKDLKKTGMTLILTTHYMEEATALCERIIIMYQGQILEDGSMEDLLRKHASHEIIEFVIASGHPGANLVHKIKHSYYLFDEEKRQGVLHVENSAAVLPQLMRKLPRKKLVSISARPLTLDDLFIKMTGRHLND